MKNKCEYIILGLIVCVFTFCVVSIKDDVNENTVATSSTAISNKSIGWGIKRAKDHKQPDLGSENKRLLDEYKGLAMGDSNSKYVYLTLMFIYLLFTWITGAVKLCCLTRVLTNPCFFLFVCLVGF